MPNFVSFLRCFFDVLCVIVLILLRKIKNEDIMMDKDNVTATDAKEYDDEVPFVGYSDRLSARPGETIKFHLSSIRPTKVKQN